MLQTPYFFKNKISNFWGEKMEKISSHFDSFLLGGNYFTSFL
jgi:hypothetical protein